MNVDIVKVYQVREDTAKYNGTVYSSTALVEMIYPMYENLDREMLSVVGMDIRNKPNVINQVSLGVLDHAPATPREIFKPLILSNCASFILVHNHPSGYLTASTSDIEFTKRMKRLGDDMKIELYDHIIIGSPDNYNSFKSNGILF